jgi:hypothetical protein
VARDVKDDVLLSSFFFIIVSSSVISYATNIFHRISVCASLFTSPYKWIQGQDGRMVARMESIIESHPLTIASVKKKKESSKNNTILHSFLFFYWSHRLDATIFITKISSSFLVFKCSIDYYWYRITLYIRKNFNLVDMNKTIKKYYIVCTVPEVIDSKWCDGECARTQTHKETSVEGTAKCYSLDYTNSI